MFLGGESLIFLMGVGLSAIGQSPDPLILAQVPLLAVRVWEMVDAWMITEEYNKRLRMQLGLSKYPYGLSIPYSP